MDEVDLLIYEYLAKDKSYKNRKNRYCYLGHLHRNKRWHEAEDVFFGKYADFAELHVGVSYSLSNGSFMFIVYRRDKGIFNSNINDADENYKQKLLVRFFDKNRSKEVDIDGDSMVNCDILSGDRSYIELADFWKRPEYFFPYKCSNNKDLVCVIEEINQPMLNVARSFANKRKMYNTYLMYGNMGDNLDFGMNAGSFHYLKSNKLTSSFVLSDDIVLYQEFFMVKHDGKQYHFPIYKRSEAPEENITEKWKQRFKESNNRRRRESPKQFVIDSNVFFENSAIFDKILEPDEVCLSITVIEELDRHKDNYNVRESIRKIRANKNIKKYGWCSYYERELDKNNADTRILNVALQLRDRNPWLITYDINLQNKAILKDIPCITPEELKSLYS